MKTKTINTNKAKQLIEDSKGKFFTAHFIKRSNNKERILNARTQKRYTPKSNRKQPYEPSKYNLLTVYDMQKRNFRMLNIDTLFKLNINKTKYLIK
jgi:hypothetical protein